uniref:Hypoxia-inducible factor 1-alpha-like protein n=1 Tax=Halisarca dujardinii TaxID=2583056 RepID=A0A6C0PN78_HALDU|nr:hypoxia-inducible factor 1-alpha-like protein [Halisarca dujardinii]
MSKHDMGYNCVHVDNKMKLLLGYDPADMITSNAFVFFHPGDLSEGHVHTAHMQMMHTGENKSPAFRALTKWGSWVWVRSLKQCLYDPTSHQPTGIAIYTWLIGPEGAMECNRAFLNLYGSSHLPNAPEQFKSVLGDQYNPSECHNPSYVPIFPEQSSPPEAVALPKKDTEMKMSPSQQSASCQSIQQVTSPDQLETQPSDQQPRARPSDQRQPRPSDQRKLQPSGQRQPHPSAQQLHLYSSEVPVSATCTPVIQHSFSSIAGAPPTHLPINPNPSMSTAPLPHLLHGGSPPHPAMANNHPNIHSIPPSSLPYVGHASNSVMFQPVQQSLILQPFCAHPSLPLSGPAMGGTAYSSNGGDIKNSHQGNSAFSPPLTPPDNCTLPPVTCSVGQVNSTYSNHPQNHHHVSQRPEYHHQTPHGQVVVMDQTRMMYPSSSLSSSSAHSNPSLAQSMASAILSPPHDTTSTASLTSLPSTNSTFTDQFPKDYYLQNASFNMTPSPSSSENCFHSSFSPPGTGNQDTYTPSPLGIKSYADYSPNREAIPNNCLNGVNNFEPKSKGFSFGDITPDNFSDFNFNAPPTVLPNASSTCERNPGIHSNAAAYQATIDVGRQQQFVSVTTHSNLS